MNFTITVTPLPGSTIYKLYRFFVNEAQVMQQISAIGAYDVTKRLEDLGHGERVPEALKQLGMVPWGRSPETMPVSTKAGHKRRAAPVGRPAGVPSGYFPDDLPSSIPPEQLEAISAVEAS